MTTTGLAQCVGALLAVAICSACGGALGQARDNIAVAPPNAALDAAYVGRTLSLNGRPVTAARVHLRPLPLHASMAPGLPANAVPLVVQRTHEYIINDYGTYATIFKYPKSDTQVGNILDVGGQGCTNVLYGYGKETFWIVAGPHQITEYEVPQKPIKTLSVTYNFPSSCAMNASGDLAVGILYGTSTGRSGGQVVVFKNASGSGTVFATPLDEEFFDGYDNHGNLFADGFTGVRSGFALVELPKGGGTFRRIATSNSVRFPGSVQWDGKYLTVFDQLANAMYRYTVSGTKATLKGTISLSGSGDCAQTWIGKGVVFCADSQNEGAEVFKYPAGGSAIAVLTGNFDIPLGTTAANK